MPFASRIVIASNNPGKLRELAALLSPLGIETVSQTQLGIEETEEPHDTFLENALAKAKHASRAARMPALADDSGLCVAALGGEPGVHSAYYAGADSTRAERDARNNAKLLAALRERSDRSAFYYCVLVLMRSFDDPTPLVAEGRWHGRIASEPQGEGGFGYDPLFAAEGNEVSNAELTPEQKDAISHRGQALRALAPHIVAALSA
jgi:XTP/dITP diphosphohydrolase